MNQPSGMPTAIGAASGGTPFGGLPIPPSPGRRIARSAIPSTPAHAHRRVMLSFPLPVLLGKGMTMIEIPLTKGYTARIDDEYAELVSRYRWRALVQSHAVYAIARLPNRDGRQRTLYLHRLVMDAKPGERVLHADRDGLNNTRANLSVQEAAPDMPPTPTSPPKPS